MKIEAEKKVRPLALGWLGLLLVLALGLVGCAALPAPPAAAPEPVRSLVEPTATVASVVVEPLPTAEATPEAASENGVVPREGDSMTIGGRPTELIERAKAEVASLARTSADSVRVVSVEGVDWSDSSLGCPQAGMMYAQVITPGYKIVLEADGKSYEFHSGRDPQGPLLSCGR